MLRSCKMMAWCTFIPCYVYISLFQHPPLLLLLTMTKCTLVCIYTSLTTMYRPGALFTVIWRALVPHHAWYTCREFRIVMPPAGWQLSSTDNTCSVLRFLQSQYSTFKQNAAARQRLRASSMSAEFLSYRRYSCHLRACTFDPRHPSHLSRSYDVWTMEPCKKLLYKNI